MYIHEVKGYFKIDIAVSVDHVYHFQNAMFAGIKFVRKPLG